MQPGLSPVAPLHRRLTVLIVEDDTRLRGLLHRALEDDVRVLEAENGAVALGILEGPVRHTLDLVLLDQVLPERSGVEILQHIKQRWPWMPVVLITGFGSEDLAIQALRAGAVDYLKKPISVSELERVIVERARKRCADPSAARGVASIHDGIRRALQFLGDHFAEPITLSQIALEARLSKFHCCRLFQQQMGLPLRRYIQQLRVDRAKILLGDPEMTISAVAYATGFNDLSHFDHVFRQIAGVSPTDYRRATLPA